MFWIWAILLLTLGLGLAIMEVFFPSAGILGFLSVSAILGAIFLGFKQGPGTGMSIVLVALVGLPAVIVLALKWWPKTAMGRRILLQSPSSEDVLPSDPHRDHLKGLVGQVGRAKSKMLPSGVITIEGRTIDAMSRGMPIEPGEPVRVIEVRGTRVVVRPLSEESPSPTAEDVMRRPIDSVASDPFEETTG